MTSARHVALTAIFLLLVLTGAAQTERGAGDPGFIETCHVYPRGTECILRLRAPGADAVEFDTAINGPSGQWSVKAKDMVAGKEASAILTVRGN